MSETPSKPGPAIDTASRQKIIYNVSLGALIVCPIIILLPPRKLDAYTIALISGTLLGANQVVLDNTGRSLVTRWSDRLGKMSGGGLPPKALETQQRLKREKDLILEQKIQGRLFEDRHGSDGVLAEIERLKEEEKEKKRSLVQKVWMGSEGPDWKAKRDEREKEALEDGRGYGGLIMDQIWEVWNWGKDKNEEVKAKDEEVLEERKKKP